MTVVRNEFESGENSPQRVLWKRMAAVAFDWHNYGKPTIGARSDIENVPIERLRAFYRTYYQPDNAVLVDRRQVRSPTATLAPIAKYVRRDSEADARAAASSTPSSRCRTASARSPCAASPARNGSARCSTCRQGANPDATAVRGARAKS